MAGACRDPLLCMFGKASERGLLEGYSPGGLCGLWEVTCGRTVVLLTGSGGVPAVDGMLMNSDD